MFLLVMGLKRMRIVVQYKQIFAVVRKRRSRQFDSSHMTSRDPILAEKNQDQTARRVNSVEDLSSVFISVLISTKKVACSTEARVSEGQAGRSSDT